MSSSPEEAAARLVKRLDGALDKQKFRGSFQVTAAPSDQGDFEYVVVARVPSIDLQLTSPAPLAVKLESTEDEFEVELPIDPMDPAAKDDAITLESTDGAYKQTKGVKDDAEMGDDVLTLRFEKVDYKKKYTLTVKPGAGDPYKIFENAPLR